MGPGIHKTAYCPDNSRVAHRQNELGMVLWNLGDLAGARTRLERAIQIDQAATGPNHPNMVICHSNLGNVLQDLGDLNSARTEYERA